MIQLIALMIGTYTATRCYSLALRQGDRQEPLTVRIMAWTTLVFTFLCLAAVIFGNGGGPPGGM